ncbi:hypothetical protein IIM_05044 [Bacillus cereus VD107]|nr:hypothetical protein IIM_05044 [Bacillus cereus VD107]
MKKGIVISIVAASTLLLQGCNNTPSKASENQNTSTKSNTELQDTKKELESLKKENDDLTKKITDLESKTDKKQKTYKLDEKLAQKIYSIYKGSPWNDEYYKGGWNFAKESDTKGIITADRGGGQPIYLLSNYAVIFETGLEDSMGQLKIIDLNTEKVIDQYPKHDNNDSKENNKETTQKSSPNTDKEKLKKQLTDKTFIAPKSNAEGRLSIAELEMSLKEYLMPKNAKHEDYELEISDGLPSDNKAVYALRKDNHIGNMAVVGYYALDGNGYIYKYNFAEEKVEDTPLTNLYIEGVLNP